VLPMILFFFVVPQASVRSAAWESWHGPCAKVRVCRGNVEKGGHLCHLCHPEEEAKG
jgi:hypothetical protein